MLNLRFKRASSPDANPNTAWAGPSSLPADPPTTVPVSTRELRTRAEMPTAPPVRTLFSRDSDAPRQTLAVWDPSGAWPGFSLSQLALSAHGRISEIALVQDAAPGAEGSPAGPTLARLRSTVLPTPSGEPLGVLEIEAAHADPRSLNVAMTLLEQADRAVLLVGASADKELIRHIGDLVRPDAWRGPALMLVSPADKPSRADRLRRAAWPRGLRTHVLELFAVNEPGWSQQLIALVTGHGAAEAAPAQAPALPAAPAPAAPPAAPAAAPLAPAADLPPIAPPAQAAEPAASRAGVASAPEVTMNRVLKVLAMGPGVVAGAVVAVEDAHLLAVHAETEGQLALLEAAARAGTAMWRAHRALGAGQPLHELAWGGMAHHHLILPLPRQPGLLLLACVEREFGDLSAARWQMAVARNQWR